MSAATLTARLKDPRTCRVFVSSPFNGLERERQELVTRYFPQLSALCQERGVQFVAADMRWGITEAASRDHQVVSICLREIDRSDIFLGLYGQRYGWHGAKDEALQSNLQLAQKQYPWLKKVRDRSVTEVEFLHGHLNSPGIMPAAFVFRSKSYDSRMAEVKGSSDTEQSYKFVAENPQAEQLLKQLKERVVRTTDKCLAVHENYSSPEEAARLLFEAVKRHLECVLLRNTKAQSRRDLDLACHDAHIASRTSIYIRDAGYFRELDHKLQKGGGGHLVKGPPGSGKTALVCNWLESVRRKKSHHLVYHFVGCSRDNANVASLISRLTREFERLAGSPRPEESLWEVQDRDEDCGDLADKLQDMEVALGKASHRKKMVIIIDGLHRLEKMSRTSKTLFWLPVHIPETVTVMVTCREDCEEVIRELTEVRRYSVTNIRPLRLQERQQLCVETLKQRSKELSGAQLKTIVEAEQTRNPLFLRILLSELCTFGNFRQLDQKIFSLVQARSVTELFDQLLDRLEQDYNTDYGTNLTQQVMCGLTLARKGLSECEIRSIFSIPALAWSPLYFAIKDFLIDYSGLLRLAFGELEEAVSKRYLSSHQTRQKLVSAMVVYFEQQRQAWPLHIEMGSALVARVTQELPWLLRLLGDKDRLAQLLLDPTIFGRLFVDEQFELLELWRMTGRSGEQVAQLYVDAITARGRHLATEAQQKDLNQVIDIVLLSYLDILSQFLEVGHFTSAQERVLLLRLEILERLGSDMEERRRLRLLGHVRLKLSHLYADLGRFQEAQALQDDVLHYRLRVVETGSVEAVEAVKDLAVCYHAIGLLSSKMGDIDKAIDYYRKSMEVQEKLQNPLELADSMNNLGVMLMKRGDYQRAADLCSRALKVYEKEYFGHLPPIIGVMISNIAVCYSSLDRLDESEKMYRKALQIAERALGRSHPNVATALTNLGTLQSKRQRYAEAKGHFKEALTIHKACLTPPANLDFFKTQEKYVWVLLKLEEQDTALSEFEQLCAQSEAGDLLTHAWPPVWSEMVAVLLARGQAAKAASLAAKLLTKGVKHESLYITLSKADSAATAKVARPREMTVDYALEQSPENLELFKYQVKEVFLPAGEVTGLLALLDRSSQTLGSDVYHLAITWCREQNKQEMELAVCRHASDMFPSDLNFATQAAVLLNDLQNYGEAAEYGMRVLSIKPNDVSVGLFVGELQLRNGRPMKAKQIFQNLEKCSPGREELVQVRQGLEVADLMMKQNK